MNPCKWIFIAVLAATVAGDTEILLHEPPAQGIWLWHISESKISEGAGWMPPSSMTMMYSVCDVYTTARPTNWLRTPFIPLRGAKLLDIKMGYFLKNCPLDASIHCNKHLGLYVHHTDGKLPNPDPAKMNYEFVENIVPEGTLPEPGKGKIFVYHGKVIAKSKDLYLAFKDEGACISIRNFTAGYKYCPEQGRDLGMFPRTIAPADDADSVQREGRCSDLNSVSQNKSVGVCLSSGKWNFTKGSECLCRKGYELVQSLPNSFECKECKKGLFKSIVSNSECGECPQHSVPNPTKTSCTCTDGFYALMPSMPCETLPLAPLNASASMVTTTHLTISWIPRNSVNRTLRYAIDCFMCESRNDTECRKLCGPNVQFQPSQDNISNASLTVDGLQSGNFYLFRVYSVNELNKEEKNRDRWKYATVFVRTKEQKRRFVRIVMSLANEEYHEDLQNLESKRSQQLIERFEQTVKEAFQTDSTFQRIHVLDFTPGSVIVKFVLIFKQSVSNDHAISILKAAVDNGKFGPFTVNTKSIMASEKDEFQIIYITGIPFSVSDRSWARTLFNRTILIAVTASCILVAVIISLVIYVIWLRRKVSEGKKRKKRTNEEPSEEDEKGNTAVEMGKLEFQRPASTTISQSREHAQLSTFPSKRSWEISRDLVTIEKIIGKGAFGQVAKGSAVGLRGMRQKTTVAVKMVKDSAPYSDQKGLLSELEVMKTLRPHPNVIRLMGCVTESEPLLVLIEYVPYGDLLGYLRKSRGMKDTYYKDPDIKPQTNLTSQQLIKFAWQIADGMKFLSSSSVIHRDLAARNVLIGERETCKVSDFGMARDVQQENIYKRSIKGRLPLKWTAYEALMYGTYTTQSDVWSYGIVLYEIFTIGGSPYPKIDRMNIVDFLQQGHRMPKPQHVDDELYKIMRICWEEDPNARPTFHNLKDTLKNMERHHKRMINMAMYDETRPYANVNVEDLAT